MRVVVIIIGLLCSFTIRAQAPIVITGTYQGMNVSIHNTLAYSGIGYSIFKIEVNGMVTTDKINKEYFLIDFSNLDLKLNDSIILKVYYTNGSLPKILNPLIIRPKSTFETKHTHIDSNDIFLWTTSNESGSLPFIVEQYKWNKWVKVGEVEGKGSLGKNDYEFKIIPHYGENKFRVSQIDYTTKRRRSETVLYNPLGLKQVSMLSNCKNTREVYFTRKTFYEVYDVNGKLVTKGFGDHIEEHAFKRGLYYLNYGSNTGEVYNFR